MQQGEQINRAPFNLAIDNKLNRLIGWHNTHQGVHIQMLIKAYTSRRSSRRAHPRVLIKASTIPLWANCAHPDVLIKAPTKPRRVSLCSFRRAHQLIHKVKAGSAGLSRPTHQCTDKVKASSLCSPRRAHQGATI